MFEKNRRLLDLLRTKITDVPVALQSEALAELDAAEKVTDVSLPAFRALEAETKKREKARYLRVVRELRADCDNRYCNGWNDACDEIARRIEVGADA